MTVEKQKRKTPDEFFKSLESYDGFLYNVYNTNTFKKNVRLCYRRNFDLDLLEEVMECHILPDWLLVWKQNDTELILMLTNTGTHSDLF